MAMQRNAYANESIHAVLTKVGQPAMTYIPDDPKNSMAGGKRKVAIGALTFDDDQELQDWLAVFLYQNGNAFDVDTLRTVAMTLTAMALETAKKNE
jgi:hypothetical protein